MSLKINERSIKAGELREVCARCGVRFGSHGAAPPHTIGDSCAGYVAPKAAP